MGGIEEKLSSKKYTIERRYKKRGLGVKGLILLTSLFQMSCPNPIITDKLESLDSSSEESGEDGSPEININTDGVVEELSNVFSSKEVAFYENIITAYKSGNSAITKIADYFTLAWDPPKNDSIMKYQLGYRERFTNPWKILGETPGGRENLEFKIYTLNDGVYEFNVRAVNYDTEKSSWHNSTDSVEEVGEENAAAPSNGWFLVYKKLPGAIHPADTDVDETVSTPELVNYIDSWNAGFVEDNNLSVAIDLWLTNHNLL